MDCACGVSMENQAPLPVGTPPALDLFRNVCSYDKFTDGLFFNRPSPKIKSLNWPKFPPERRVRCQFDYA